MWVQLAWVVVMALVSAAISYALQKKPTTPPPSPAEAITSPTLDAGTPLQVVFGRKRVRNPNTLYYGGDRTEEIKK